MADVFEFEPLSASLAKVTRTKVVFTPDPKRLEIVRTACVNAGGVQSSIEKHPYPTAADAAKGAATVLPYIALVAEELGKAEPTIRVYWHRAADGSTGLVEPIYKLNPDGTPVTVAAKTTKPGVTPRMQRVRIGWTGSESNLPLAQYFWAIRLADPRERAPKETATK